jgi:hypothetical protein
VLRLAAVALGVAIRAQVRRGRGTDRLRAQRPATLLLFARSGSAHDGLPASSASPTVEIRKDAGVNSTSGDSD